MVVYDKILFETYILQLTQKYCTIIFHITESHVLCSFSGLPIAYLLPYMGTQHRHQKANMTLQFSIIFGIIPISG